MRRGVQLLALAGVYAAVGRLGLAIAPVHDFAALVWPPTGLALAALLRLGAGLWPGVALGAFAVNAWTGASVPVALGIATGNTLEAVLGAHLVARFAGAGSTLGRVADVLVFIAGGALLSTLVSATIGVASLLAGGVVPPAAALETWRVWWLGDVVGDLVIGASLLAWTGRSRAPGTAPRRGEAAALAALVVAATLAVFLRSPLTAAAGFVQACLLLPVLMLAALRFEERGATASVLVASVVAIVATALGLGPFVQGTLSASLLYLQAFIAVAASAVLTVGAGAAERAEALRRARSLAEFPEQGPNPVLRATLDGTLRYANPPARALLDAMGSRDGALPDVLLEPLRRVPPGGALGELEVAVPRGRAYVFVLSRSAGVDHVNLFGLDITDRKRAEEALREADRRKGEFLGVLSHELRNPLAPIRTALHLLRHGPGGGDRERRSLAVIERQTGQLARLVDDLLDITRISRGKIQLRRRPVELGELVRNAVEDQRVLYDARGVAIELRLEANPSPWIDADPARIAQVVGNLLQNSAKFTRARGRVTVVVARAGEEAEVRVSDEGIGIDPSVLPTIFEPFTQVDKSLDRTSGGLGLGLAVAKALVELHGGSLEATSPGLGLGAEFTLRLPVVATEGRSPAAGAPGAAPQQKAGRRVLVIEDNVDGAAMLEEALLMMGHEVAVAHTGEEGLVTARAFRPDAVICDVGLPGLDGYEVARRLRGDRGLPATLIAMTGYALPEDRARALEAGFDVHLAKPVDLAALEAVLDGAGIAPAAAGT